MPAASILILVIGLSLVSSVPLPAAEYLFFDPAKSRRATPRRSLRASSARRRHSLEGQLLHAAVGAGDVDVALRVGGDLVSAADHARPLDRADDRQRLAVNDDDFLAAADV